jgi:hypothetical protein
MTPEAQRIAIAEACGWMHVRSLGCQYRRWHDIDGKRYGETIECLPDYLNDLNAMASAEKMLPCERLGDYLNRLVELTGYCDTKTFTQANFDLATATASQRAEAFLRALNLWVEPTTATKP